MLWVLIIDESDDTGRSGNLLPRGSSSWLITSPSISLFSFIPRHKNLLPYLYWRVFLKESGANVIVSGSTIFKENSGDLKKNIELLRSN